MQDIELVNCTPHAITIIKGGAQNIEVPRSVNVARCSEARSQLALVQGIPIYATQFGAIENLPEPVENTWFIVSRVVAQAAQTRNDLLVPDSLVRSATGGILGCRGLSKPR